MRASLPSPVRIAVLAGLAVLLSGCNSTLVRQETMAFSSGDAVAWNRAVHTIDPWPVASSDTTIPTSGRRVAQAIENYESALTKAAPNPTATVSFVPLTPMTPGAGPLK